MEDKQFLAKSLAKKLQALRKNKGFTQKKLGSILNVTDAAVGMWEQARRLPDPETLAHLADIFDVSVDFLLGRIAFKERYHPDETSALDTGDGDDNQEILAAHRSDDPTQELPEEARRSLEEFKDYILKKYSK